MPVLPSRRQIIRPDEYQGINWDSPQAQGLLHYWPLDGRSLYGNLVTGVPLTINAGSSYQFIGHPTLGQSLYLPTSGNNYSMLISGLADVPAPWTFFLRWHRNAGPTTVSVLSSKSGSTNGIRSEQFNNTKALGYTYGGTDGTLGLVTPTTRAVGIVYAQRSDAGSTALTCYLYDDEGTLTPLSSATLPTLSAALPLSRIGNYADSVSLATYGFFGHMGVVNRAWSQDEARIFLEPETRWDLLWTPSRRSYAFLSGTVFTVTVGLDIGAGLQPAGRLTAQGSASLGTGVSAGPGGQGQLQGAAAMSVAAGLSPKAVAQAQAVIAQIVSAAYGATPSPIRQGAVTLGATAAQSTTATAQALGVLAYAVVAGLTTAGHGTVGGAVPLGTVASVTPSSQVVAAALLALAADAQLAAIASLPGSGGATTVAVQLGAVAAAAVSSQQLAGAIAQFVAQAGLTAAPRATQASALALAILADLPVISRQLSTGGIALGLSGLVVPGGTTSAQAGTGLASGAGVTPTGAAQANASMLLAVATLLDLAAAGSGDPTITLLAIVSEQLQIAGVRTEAIERASVSAEHLLVPRVTGEAFEP